MTPEEYLARVDATIRELRKARKELREAIRESDRLAREA